MPIYNIEKKLQSDIVSIQKIPIIPTILDVICSTTGMGFAAIARVTENKWITCSVLDKISFGLNVGDELKVETTLCNEVRQSSKAVIIDNVDKDELYCLHHTPKMYGFKSYISIPIIRKDGSFFGTLCAIDPKPNKLNTPEIQGMFKLFCDLISFHLNAVEQVALSETRLLKEKEERTKAVELKNVELQRMNSELESFAHVASHDLQEPLRKIQTFSSFILEKDYDKLTDYGKHNFNRLLNSVRRMETLIKDLIMYTQVKVHEQIFENTEVSAIAEEVKQYFLELTDHKKVSIEVSGKCHANIIPFQFKQLLTNLIGNSIKYAKPGDEPVILISISYESGNILINEKLLPQNNYCHICISDNGIGFEPKYSEKIFEIFQRLNGRGEYDGTGIGLSIVKKIVDNHHGSITATGEVDKGARFDIYIPQL